MADAVASLVFGPPRFILIGAIVLGTFALMWTRQGVLVALFAILSFGGLLMTVTGIEAFTDIVYCGQKPMPPQPDWRCFPYGGDYATNLQSQHATAPTAFWCFSALVAVSVAATVAVWARGKRTVRKTAR